MSLRHTRFAAQLVTIAGLAPLAAADAVIRPDSSQVEARPGDTVRMLWLIEDISIPLFGYSLALRPIDNGGLPQLGSVSIDVDASNFFEPRNVIVAGGKDLHPTFTLITGQADGGAFFSTNTADFSTVLVQQK